MQSEQKLTIKKVNPSSGGVIKTLSALHWLSFFDTAPIPEWKSGYWWIVYSDKNPIGFAGIREAYHNTGYGYLERTGVLPCARGQSLQRRLIKVREKFARKNKWLGLVTDTLDNPYSANNLIASGFTMFSPKKRWGHSEAVYWKKDF